MFIAIDIGGTKTQVAGFQTIDPKSQINLSEFPTPNTYLDCLTTVSSHIQQFDQNPQGIAIALAGRVSPDGTLVSHSNLPDYQGKNLKLDLQTRFPKGNIAIVNDAVCAAHAQIRFGQAQKVGSVLHLVIGTGVGGAYCLVKNRAITDIPLEPGWTIIHPGGLPHTHSSIKGLLEAYVAGGQLSAQLARPLTQVPDADLIWTQASHYLGMALYNLIQLLNPSRITLSGGLIQKRPFLLDKIIRHLGQYSQITLPPIQITTIPHPSLIGALTFLE